MSLRLAVRAAALMLAVASGLSCTAAPARQREGIPDTMAARGYRYWREDFRVTPLWGCYVSVTPREGRLEFWNCNKEGEFALAVWRGPSLSRLGEPTTVFRAAQIDDVVHRQHPKVKWDKPRFDRCHVQHIPSVGYVAFICVNPEYKPGTVDLMPAIALSPEGSQGDGKYFGKLKGDPADIAAKQMIWSDGGTIFRLQNDRWRIYLNGYKTTLAALESDELGGPWKFLRDKGGQILELCPDYERLTARHGSCFPNLLRVGEREWHLWLSDQWEPENIWHFWSDDGLSWKPYGRQPEVTQKAAGDRGIKCVRTYFDPALGRIVGMLSVWEERGKDDYAWRLYESWMPAGPPPELRE